LLSHSWTWFIGFHPLVGSPGKSRVRERAFLTCTTGPSSQQESVALAKKHLNLWQELYQN